MLRVNTARQGSGYRIELHGTLGGEWVALLEQHWRTILDDAASEGGTVVLSDVDFIDADGVRLLQRMAEDRFVVSGCMNRYVVEKLQAKGLPTTPGARP
jgi:hypothetical protein